MNWAAYVLIGIFVLVGAFVSWIGVRSARKLGPRVRSGLVLYLVTVWVLLLGLVALTLVVAL